MTTTESLHIPEMAGKAINGFSLFGVGISNTVLSTWCMMAIMFVVIMFFYAAIRKNKSSKWRSHGLFVVGKLDDFLLDSLGDKAFVRKFFFLF